MATEGKKRNFHWGWARRPYGCRHKRFSRDLWDLWLEDLNREPKASRVQGIHEMRSLLAARETAS